MSEPITSAIPKKIICLPWFLLKSKNTESSGEVEAENTFNTPKTESNRYKNSKNQSGLALLLANEEL
jgi:hypothetical protein